MSVSATRLLRGSGGIVASGQLTFTADGRLTQSFQVADSVSDQERTLEIDISELQWFCIQSDQDLTLKFNSTVTPLPQIALKANAPYEEFTAAYQYHVAKFTVDITKVYISNSSGSAANVSIIVMKNNTP